MDLLAMQFSFGWDALVGLVALTAMEIVLGIDNIVFIAILTSRLPAEQQSKARTIGLGLAMGARIALLLTITWILQLTDPFFYLTSIGIPEHWLGEEANGISVKDLILLLGGLFLVGKAVKEIHTKVEGEDHEANIASRPSFKSVIAQIVVIDIVFSLDSVITAVGMVDASLQWVMILAVIIAVIVMMIFAGPVSRFVNDHQTLKMLALAFLILIGVMLIAEGAGTHFNKGYIYFAMAFALGVETLNLRASIKKKRRDEDAASEKK